MSKETSNVDARDEASVERLEKFMSESFQEPGAALGNTLILNTLNRIENLLLMQHRATLNHADAAGFLGVTEAELDQLVAANPTLRPVTIFRGRVGWRRTDLAAWLAGLGQ